MSRRTERVNELLREELSQLIQREVKDPRLEGAFASVTEVDVSPDLRHANVFVSFLGEAGARDGALQALQHASNFLHNQLMRRLAMRNVPALTFRFDPSIERGARLAALIHEVEGTHVEAAPDRA
ncbi:MAG: 30S ribosome-binding factor RbfA [Dehalococcoidia bacterium]